MSQHLITTPARAATCNACGSTVIHAVTGGLTTITDTTPLSVNEEIAAILAGRSTFDLQTAGNQLYLEWRDVTRIRAGRNYPVLAIHGCARGAQHPIPPAPSNNSLPDDPPF